LRVEVISPLFPAYGFIVIEQQWHSARWSIGVTAIIMDGAAPARVPDQVIDEIQRREVRGVVELPKAPGMKIGERVRVLGEPFRGHFGLYAGMKPHERVEVLLVLLGSQRRVTLPRGSIELAPASGP
jgi:transcription antitermination factor NusG